MMPDKKKIEAREGATLRLYAEDIAILKKGGYLYGQAFGRWVMIKYMGKASTHKRVVK
jgi:hypothetical protein